MRRNLVKEKLKAGKTVFGVFANAQNPELIEIMGITGFDFIMIDSEHSSSDPRDNRLLNMAGESRNITMMTRVPDKLESTILRNLDAGAMGLLVPQVNTKEEAEKIVRAATYYPEGMRGFSLPRNADYGIGVSPDVYIRNNNEHMLIAVQCENIRGVPNLEEIASVDGVDIIFIGPFDLTESMGIPGQVNNERVKDVIEKVLDVTSRCEKYAGIFATSAEQTKAYEQMGFKYIIVCTDLMLFGQACKNLKCQLDK